ncbi:arginyltransferase [Halobacteriovorax sp. HLS]|uniref:arginyltransferase n=1 Tax=Halobacteriovorax sp. HLS TaxID=2234000 RepID=UPI000FD73FAB|nr:arginyltransferase [Halobacteriovorax sp. HLS]
MKILSMPKLSPQAQCPYLESEHSKQQYFFASEIDADEMNELLNSGWRKFGAYLFRPACEACKKCTPTRIDITNFTLNKKQRKLMKKKEFFQIKRSSLYYDPIFYSIFKNHSKERFSQTEEEIGTEDGFIETFFFNTSTSEIITYEMDNTIIAWGIIDIASESISSVYFAFDPSFSKYSLGKLSILIEIEIAQTLGLKSYHLGYYVEGNSAMSYKINYASVEQMDWKNNEWTQLLN